MANVEIKVSVDDAGLVKLGEDARVSAAALSGIDVAANGTAKVVGGVLFESVAQCDSALKMLNTAFNAATTDAERLNYSKTISELEALRERMNSLNVEVNQNTGALEENVIAHHRLTGAFGINGEAIADMRRQHKANQFVLTGTREAVDSLSFAVIGLSGLMQGQGQTAERIAKAMNTTIMVYQSMNFVQEIYRIKAMASAAAVEGLAVAEGEAAVAGTAFNISTGGIITGVSLLVAVGAGALAYFTSDKEKTEDATKAKKEYNDELKKTFEETLKFSPDKVDSLYAKEISRQQELAGWLYTVSTKKGELVYVDGKLQKATNELEQSLTNEYHSSNDLLSVYETIRQKKADALKVNEQYLKSLTSPFDLKEKIKDLELLKDAEGATPQQVMFANKMLEIAKARLDVIEKMGTHGNEDKKFEEKLANLKDEYDLGKISLSVYTSQLARLYDMAKTDKERLAVLKAINEENDKADQKAQDTLGKEKEIETKQREARIKYYADGAKEYEKDEKTREEFLRRYLKTSRDLDKEEIEDVKLLEAKKILTHQQAAAMIAKIEERSTNGQIDMTQQMLSSITPLLTQQTVAYQLVASAQATMDTYKAANLALATYPPPFGEIAMGAAIGVGLTNVAEIWGVKFETGGFPVGKNALIRVNENGQEAVLNATATRMLGFDMINALNRADFSLLPTMVTSLTSNGGSHSTSPLSPRYKGGESELVDEVKKMNKKMDEQLLQFKQLNTTGTKQLKKNYSPVVIAKDMALSLQKAGEKKVRFSV